MKNKKIFWFLLVVVILVVLILLSLSLKRYEVRKEINQVPLEKVKVQAGWILNGEFANVCSSIVEGYYKDEGLDVELVPGGPSGASFIISTNALAQDKSIDIAIDGDLVPLLRGVTQKRDEEKIRVKAFAAFWDENPYGFIVRADSGINNFIDLANKTKANGKKYKIGITADSVAQFAIAKYASTTVEKLNLTTVGFDASPFISGQVDALAAYWTTQAYEVEKAGIKYKFLNYGDIPGLSQPSMIAIARDETIKNKPDMLVKWLRATIKGTEFVKNNPEKAAENVLSEACGGKVLNKDQELWLIKKSIPLFSEEKIGNLNIDQISKFGKSYYDLGQIPSNPDINSVVDLSILNKIYSNK